MDDRATRVILSLALLPCIWVVFWIAADAVDPRVAAISGVCVAMVASVAVWWSYGRWSVLRGAGVGGAAILLLVQTVIWIPMFPAGCAADLVCSAQTSAGLGTWAVISTILVWLSVWRRRPDAAGGRNAMTRVTLRLVFAIGMLPLFVGAFWLTPYALEALAPADRTDGTVLSLAFLAAVAPFAAFWVLLWRSAVRWTAARVRGTLYFLGLLLPAMFGPWFGELYFEYPGGELPHAIANATPLFAFSLWLGGTAWLWRETNAAVVLRQALSSAPPPSPQCAACGYSLTGLREVRCPECGWTSTVDEVFARQVLLLAESR